MKYIPLYRPAGFATLPAGVTYKFVEAPQGENWNPHIGLPVSRHRYGVIETDRELTQDEIATFQLRAL